MVKSIIIKNYNFLLQKIYKIKVASILKSIDELHEHKRSLVRFGDGEICIICGGKVGFQENSSQLSNRLKEILSSKDRELMIAVPGPVGENYSHLTEKAAKWWRMNMLTEFYLWKRYLDCNIQYYDSMLSRFYVGIKDHNLSKEIYNKLKEVWTNKSILIIEGDKTKMGVGNDLFDNAEQVKRILCPAENAFQKYDSILTESIKYASNFDLVLISLGPTAKVLAYDLYKQGFWAVDIGHVDNEYEWMLAGKGKRVPISGKYVNEIKDGNVVVEIKNEKYEKEILSKIL